jgi:hypothetical protein
VDVVVANSTVMVDTEIQMAVMKAARDRAGAAVDGPAAVSFPLNGPWQLNTGEASGAVSLGSHATSLPHPSLPAADGIDCRCRNAVIRNNFIQNWDDAVAIKPLSGSDVLAQVRVQVPALTPHGCRSPLPSPYLSRLRACSAARTWRCTTSRWCTAWA